MKIKLVENKGITLIALIVTIVVLVMLTTITINMTLGENGIIKKAQDTGKKVNEMEYGTQSYINELQQELENKIITNTVEPDKPEKPEEKPPETIEDAKDSGKEFTDDKTEVEDSNGNKVIIPGGFIVAPDSGDTVEQGIVIEDVSASGDENVKGSQFVWIPIGTFIKDDGTTSKEIVLGRYTLDIEKQELELRQPAYTPQSPQNYNKYTDEVLITSQSGTMHAEYPTYREGVLDRGTSGLNASPDNLEAFVKSVQENGGYYIARYEASYASGTDIGSYKAASKISTAYGSSMNYKVGTLWNRITQLDASKVSINTYSNAKTVKSDLINSYAWDTALVYIEEARNENYMYKLSINHSLANTGTIGDEICKINDMASNITEFTTEYCTKVDFGKYANPCTYRGGFYDSSAYYPACRNSCYSTNYSESTGFRYIIYIK